jgi:sulfite exporter TauE/SafE/copper chaperone CopZ
MGNQKTHTFHVSGMHCQACVLLTEEMLREAPGVSSVRSDLASHSAAITGDFGDRTTTDLATELSKRLEPHGYSLSLQDERGSARWVDFKLAVPIALLFAVLFVLLQKAGLVNLIGGGRLSLGGVFLIGVVASLSSCMAVVGGLLLSMSATFARSGDRVRPQLLFHVGRIVSFFLLGGVIGSFGTAFTLNVWASSTLSLLIGLVMLVLGLNLLDVFPWAKRLQPSMPRFLSRHALGASKLNHALTPLLVGVGTFFLPCGFTQSMQLYTLSTGGFLAGGLTMLVFALGTLPVLAALSFSASTVRTSARSGVFFKTAGLVVIMFALLNLASSLAAIGLIPPLLNL